MTVEVCGCTAYSLKAHHVTTPAPLQLHLDSYRAFMEHMCPGTALAGQVPPPGTDPAACPKPIMGIYDDHDFGWNNGNRRCAGGNGA